MKSSQEFFWSNKTKKDTIELKIPEGSKILSQLDLKCMETIEHNVDPMQAQYLKEDCILVDENDMVMGRDSKLNCHFREGRLHRAFSVFLFAPNPTTGSMELLIQQRSVEKITFPALFTNSCCSHPRFCDAELEESNNHIGIRRAAVRKLSHELGLDPSLVFDAS